MPKYLKVLNAIDSRASVEINLKAAGHLQYAMQHDLPRMSPEKRWSYGLPCQLGMVNNVPNILVCYCFCACAGYIRRNRSGSGVCGTVRGEAGGEGDEETKRAL